jgi:glyoxylase-like metal-dependent hydrolase (beta-lactamase superfamily II)
MIRTLLSTTALAGSIAGVALAQAPSPPPEPVRSITEVAGDVYRFQDNQHFGVFMVTSEGIVVVDPINLAASEWLKGELESRFDVPVTHVLYSHHHWDHASGAAAFPDATVLAHAATATALAGPAADTPLSPPQQAQDADGDGLLQPGETTGPVAANFAAGDENGDGGLTAREAFLAQVANVRRPTATFDAPYDLVLGGKTVHLEPVGGLHAADMTYVLFPEEKVLFVVDVIGIKRLPFMNLPGYDEADSNALFDKALALEFDTVVPGHGDIGARQDLLDQVQYFADLKAGVQAGIDAGESLEQIQASLTLDQYSAWGNYENWRSLNIAGMHAYLTRE